MSETRLRIGELSQHTGVPRHTIRFYEREGILPAPERSAAGYRKYGSGAVERLEFIRKGQSLGLKLAEIAEVLQIAEGGRAPCGHVRDLIRTRLAETEMRVRELEALKETLRDTLRRLDAAEDPRRTADAPTRGCGCDVIEGIPLEGVAPGSDRHLFGKE